MLGLCNNINGQQQVLLTQYFDHFVFINPAYSGSSGMLNISGIHREQWIGFSGAPKSSLISFNMPSKYESLGIGANISRDEIGPVNRSDLQFSCSYKLKISETQSVLFGLSGSVGLFSSITSNLISINENDPTKLLDQRNQLTSNIGTGVFYKRKNFYTGLSIPKIIENKSSNNMTQFNRRHYYFQIGGLIKINDNLKLRPSSLLTLVKGSPLNIDVNTALIYNERFIFGGIYRLQAAAGAFFQFQINDKFRIGIASDFSVNRIKNFSYGTYEIGLSYDLSLKYHKGQVFRYF